MKKLFSSALVLASLTVSSLAAPSPKPKPAAAPAKPVVAKRIAPEIMPLSEVKRGMKAVAYTVFEGTKIEPMDVDILGVLPNMAGPKSDVIVCQLKGEKPEYTGVVAGMSGSPVYINGKLIGALAYRLGTFTKEAICGITPIQQMLEINEIDQSVTPISTPAPAPNPLARTSIGGQPDSFATADVQQYAQYMKPIGAPFVFSGFSEDTLRQFGSQFAAIGLMPVMGAGGASKEPQPEPLEPGAAVSAALVTGDLDIAGTCTVTYMDAERLLACGHPLLQYGKVAMPMTKANIVATVASPLNAYKIANTTEEVGSFVQDRHNGILGRFGETAKMIPVTVAIHGGAEPKTLHFAMINNAKLTPLLMMSAVYQSLQGQNQYGEEITYRMRGDIDVHGFPSVKLGNMFASFDNSPTALSAALNVGEKFNRIFDNPYREPEIEGVNLEFDFVPERRAARLEAARTDVTEVRPGDEVVVEAVLRPYRGERIVRQVPVRIPTSTPKGTLRILVSDGDTLDRARRLPQNFGRKLQLDATIAMLNGEHANQGLYVSLLEPNPQAMVEDKVMPGLPMSVMNVMDGMRGTQDMYVTGESAVNEASTPVDYVVSGAQIITVQVK